jgi:transposase InsO family protein
MNKVKWKSIRGLKWKELYIDLKIYLETGDLPQGKSPSSLSRFKRTATKFELENEDIILLTNTLPPNLLDEDGNPLVDVNLPMKFIVCDPKNKTETIKTFFSSVLGSNYKGIENCYRKISAQYLGITRQDISKVLKRMEIKQLKRPTLQRELKPIIASKPMEYLQLDLMDFSKLKYEKFNNGYVYLLNIIDIFSKFLWCFPIKNKSGEVVADIIQKLILSEGTPEILASDNGTEFNNQDITELAERYGIDVRHGQPYKSNTQGAVERVNGTIRDSIFSYLKDHDSKRWVDNLHFFVYSYNTSVHSTTKLTPFQVHRRKNEVFRMDQFVKKNLQKNAEKMVKRFAKSNSGVEKKPRKKKDPQVISVNDDVRVSTQSQIEVRASGDIVVKSKKHKQVLYGFTRETYKVLSITKKPDGTVLYKLSGEHKRNYYLRNEIQKVNLEGLIKMGKKNKVDLNFKQGGHDLEEHLKNLHSRKEADLTQEELEEKHENDVMVDKTSLLDERDTTVGKRRKSKRQEEAATQALIKQLTRNVDSF